MKLQLIPRKVSLWMLLATVATSAVLIWALVMARRHQSYRDFSDRYAQLGQQKRKEAQQHLRTGQARVPSVRVGLASWASANNYFDWRGNLRRCEREAEEFERLEKLYREASRRPWSAIPPDGPLR